MISMKSMTEMLDMTELAKGKFLYGTVTVGERGQIVLPIEARRHFNIKPGDKLMLAGDLKKGLVIQKAAMWKDVALKVLGLLGGKAKEEEMEKEE
jgi:AbrB family looped-hinge helix DNA binding protein